MKTTLLYLAQDFGADFAEEVVTLHDEVLHDLVVEIVLDGVLGRAEIICGIGRGGEGGREVACVSPQKVAASVMPNWRGRQRCA